MHVPIGSTATPCTRSTRPPVVAPPAHAPAGSGRVAFTPQFCLELLSRLTLGTNFPFLCLENLSWNTRRVAARAHKHLPKAFRERWRLALEEACDLNLKLARVEILLFFKEVENKRNNNLVREPQDLENLGADPGFEDREADLGHVHLLLEALGKSHRFLELAHLVAEPRILSDRSPPEEASAHRRRLLGDLPTRASGDNRCGLLPQSSTAQPKRLL